MSLYRFNHWLIPLPLLYRTIEVGVHLFAPITGIRNKKWSWHLDKRDRSLSREHKRLLCLRLHTIERGQATSFSSPKSGEDFWRKSAFSRRLSSPFILKTRIPYTMSKRASRWTSRDFSRCGKNILSLFFLLLLLLFPFSFFLSFFLGISTTMSTVFLFLRLCLLVVSSRMILMFSLVDKWALCFIILFREMEYYPFFFQKIRNYWEFLLFLWFIYFFSRDIFLEERKNRGIVTKRGDALCFSGRIIIRMNYSSIIWYLRKSISYSYLQLPQVVVDIPKISFV